MTEKDANNLIKLLSTEKQVINIDKSDSEILKAVVYNQALRAAERLIISYQLGDITPDLLNELP